MFMSLMRKEVPIFLTGLMGAIIFAEYYIGAPEIKLVSAELKNWAVIIASFTVFISTFKMFVSNWSKIVKREPKQWYISIWFLFITSFMLIIGVLYSVNNSVYVWLFNNIYYTLSSSTNALMGFFIASAAFRAFKMRNIESAILLVSATLVAFTNVPIGIMLWKDFPMIGTWIRDVVNTAAFRGITIGVGVGVVFLGIRRLLGRAGGI